MKKQKLFILCAVLLAGFLCGCTNSHFIIDDTIEEYSNIKKIFEKRSLFLLGYGQET